MDAPKGGSEDELLVRIMLLVTLELPGVEGGRAGLEVALY